MKRLFLFLAALAGLSGRALFAQDFTGTWQAEFKSDTQEVRLVVRISLADGKLSATNYAITRQGSQAIPASAISQNGSTLRIDIASIPAKFEGRLSTDGKTISGTWTQGDSQPLTLAKATRETEWLIPEPVPALQMMPADAKPQFEVATIKSPRPDERYSLMVNPRSGMLNTTASSLSDLIKFAYDLHPHQILGGPAWLESEKFDVTAKPDSPGIPRLSQLKVMLQKLLADRFALKFHNEQREMNAYALAVARSGIRMTEEKSTPDGLPGFGGVPQSGFAARNTTMTEFANIMQAIYLDQAVVDQTGLGSARFNFIVKWTPDASMMPTGAVQTNAAPGPDKEVPPDIFAAFQQQLGLQLKKARMPVTVMIIDHVEQPSAN